MKRNTKYLKWGEESLSISFRDVTIFCDPTTAVFQPIGSGWQGWRIARHKCFSVQIPSSIARQLSRHLIFEKEYLTFDQFKINFE